MTKNPLVWLGLFLGGCISGPDGIYFVEIPTAAELDCEVTYGENFEDADPPDDTVTTEDWIYTDEVDESPRGLFMQIIGGKKDEVFLLIGDSNNETGMDYAYPGVRDKDVMTFTWDAFTDDVYSEQHTSGYLWADEEHSTTNNTIVLTKNKDTGGFNGTWDITGEYQVAYTESDRWEPEVGLYTGQINTLAQIYLVGVGTSNESDRDDCDSDPCYLDVISSCSGGTTFTARKTDLSDASAFDSIESYGQSDGI